MSANEGIDCAGIVELTGIGPLGAVPPLIGPPLLEMSNFAQQSISLRFDSLAIVGKCRISEATKPSANFWTGVGCHDVVLCHVSCVMQGVVLLSLSDAIMRRPTTLQHLLGCLIADGIVGLLLRSRQKLRNTAPVSTIRTGARTTPCIMCHNISYPSSKTGRIKNGALQGPILEVARRRPVMKRSNRSAGFRSAGL